MLFFAPFPQVPEIMRLICEHLASDKCTLARLARTCKMFEEPALNVLWFEISGFYPLVKCLPDDALKEEKRKYNSQYLTLARHIRPAELSRYLHYFRKVQYFSNEDYRPSTDVSTYHVLQVSVHGGKLLPNLRHLTWSFRNDSYGSIGLLYMFLGTYLSKVSLKFSSELPVSELSIFTALSDLCPSLHCISVDISASQRIYGYTSINDPRASARRGALEALSHSIYKWNDLKTLTVTNLAYSALNMVSQLPQLRRLVIENCNFHSAELKPSSGSGFSALTDLVLRECLSGLDCVAILKAMDRSPIITMEMGFKDEIPSSIWEDILLAIGQRCNQQTLQILTCAERVEYSDASYVHEHSGEISFDALRSLLAFRNVQSITLDTTKVISVPNASALVEVATSWTKIRHLNFKLQRHFIGYLDLPNITLMDLTSFAKHCPELEVLGIHFDASSPPHINEDSVFAVKKYNTRLSKLDVGLSPINNAGLVAANLSGIFPSLKNIVATPMPHSFDHYDRTWAQVDELVSVFSAVRKQAMQWSSV